MSGGDRKTPEELAREVGEMGRSQEVEAEAWWSAVERVDGGALPDGAPPLEVLRPLDAQEKDALARALLEPAEAAAKSSAAAGATVVTLPLPPAAARVSRRWMVGAAAAALAAAALALLFLRPVEPLPQYQLQVSAGEQVWRSGEPIRAELPEYAPGSRLELVLRPERPVSAPPPVQAGLQDEDRRQLPWPGPIEHGAGGGVRLRAEIGGDLPLHPGDWRVWVSVGAQRFEHRFRVRPAETEH